MQELRNAKTDRSALAALFVELAVRLKDEDGNSKGRPSQVRMPPRRKDPMAPTPADLKRDPEYDQGRDELAELPALLLGQQLVELEALRKRLDDPEVRAEELSQILGKAVVLSVKRDGRLQRSFYPIVEQALKISIHKNPGLLATSLAPIIGDAVRKAVANALRDMAESINFMWSAASPGRV